MATAAPDDHFFKAWGIVTELERRYLLGSHPGAIRVLAYLNSAHMGSYQEAVADNHNLNSGCPRRHRSRAGLPDQIRLRPER